MTDKKDASAMNAILLTSADELSSMLETLADAVLARHGACDDLVLVGVQRRGVILAERLRGIMSAKLGRPVPYGSLDITLYRDDWTTKGPKPSIGETRLRFDVRDKILVLVDDVLYTGRTIRAALEALVDFGRPRKVELLVLVDRGHRELPIHADYTGLCIETSRDQHVDVLVNEIDGKDGIRLGKS